jgi:hypothetical protein
MIQALIFLLGIPLILSAEIQVYPQLSLEQNIFVHCFREVYQIDDTWPNSDYVSGRKDAYKEILVLYQERGILDNRTYESYCLMRTFKNEKPPDE